MGVKAAMKRILLIEDCEFEAKRLNSLRDTYELIHRPRGDLALSYLSRNKVDLILLDLNLEGMHGYEILEKVRKDSAFFDHPIIIITASDSIADEEKGLRLGANDFLRKPFSEGILRLRIKKELDVREYIDKISMLQYIDGLTKVHNRPYFDLKLSDTISSHRRGKKSFILILIDIDKFKKFNDTHGHVGGDKCLQQFVVVLQSCMKREDDAVFRYGGEEFAIILPDSTRQSAESYVQSIHSAIKNTAIYLSDGKKVFITASFGVHEVKIDDKTVPQYVIEKADTALYHSKERGRDRITWI